MPRYIDDRCLANFVAIYECGNLRRAADKVRLTQPAMSKSLARIEDDLGVLLFVRRNRGLAPTQAAHELYNCAQKIETETRRSLVRIAGLDSSVRGRIRIGAGQMWSWTRIPQVVHKFLSAFPNLEVDLVTAPMKTLVDRLESGEIDIAVGDMSEVLLPPGCQEHRFQSTVQWPHFRRGHPLSAKADIGLADIIEYPWIGFFNDSVFLGNVAAICEAEGLPLPSIPIRTTSLASGMSIAQQGDYVFVLPEDLDDSAAAFGLEPVKSRSLRTWMLQTSAVFYDDEHKLGPLHALVEFMNEVVLENGRRLSA